MKPHRAKCEHGVPWFVFCWQCAEPPPRKNSKLILWRVDRIAPTYHCEWCHRVELDFMHQLESVFNPMTEGVVWLWTGAQLGPF